MNQLKLRRRSKMKNILTIINEFGGNMQTVILIKKMINPEKEIECLSALIRVKIIGISDKGKYIFIVNKEAFMKLLEIYGVDDE